MAATHGARKRRRAKAPSRPLQLALTSHNLDIPSKDDTMIATLPVLTSLDPPNEATKVFAVTELLEAVLLLLTRKDVLLCQRVNRTWKGAVIGSIKLQRHLFLAAEKDRGVMAIMAPALMPAELRVTRYAQRDNREAQETETLCQPLVPNPLIFFNADLHNRGASLQESNISYADLLAHSHLPFHNIDLLAGLFSGLLSHSACLEMFLTQPPVCEVSVELNILKCNHCSGRETCCFALSNVKNAKGLRVRDIFAAVRSFHFRRAVCNGEEEQEDATSISIGFRAVVEGSKDGVLLVTAEDMRLADIEASRLAGTAKVAVIQDD